MAEEADIKRIVIQVDGDDISQRETSQTESEALHSRLEEVIQEIAAGEHPEPVIPTYHPEESSPEPTVDQNAKQEDSQLDTAENLNSLADSVDDLVEVMGGGSPSGTNGSGGSGSPPPVPSGSGGGSSPPQGGGGGGVGPAPPSPPTPPVPPGGSPPTPPPPPVPPGRPPTPPPVPPGPPPVPAGGAAVGGMGGAAGVAGMAAEFLGPIGLTIVAIEAVVTTVEELVAIAQDIDAHIMSLADDIRPYSGEVQTADAYAMIREMTAMMERSKAIGTDVASYEVSRADFNAALTNLVTKLEQEFLPIAVIAMNGLAGIAEFVDTNSDAIVNLLTVVSPHIIGVYRLLAKFLRIQADGINKENLDKVENIFTQIDQLMRGDIDFGTKQDRARMRELFPTANGVFF